MDAKKYLDFAFETAVDTIDVGAFKHDDALSIIITGMKAFIKRNGFEFTDEQIRERAVAGLKELEVADADFDSKHRADSVNAPKGISREEFLEYAFQSATASIEPGLFQSDVAEKIITTGMQAYSQENNQGFTAEEIRTFVAKKMKELAVANADFDTEHRADSVNAPKESTKEDYLNYAFESVAATLDLGGFTPDVAFKVLVTGMKAYAYDNNQKFDNKEVIEFAQKKLKEIDRASDDYSYQNWAMPR